MEQPSILHSSREKAEEIAAACQRQDEDGWTYKVEQHGSWFAIVVRDEDNNILGEL